MITRESVRMTPSELLKLSRERSEEIFESERILEQGIERNRQIELDSYYKEKTATIVEGARLKATKIKFINDVKTALISECLYKLYKDCSVAPLTENDKRIAKRLVQNFVNENGAQNLMTSFKTKNIVLSEFSRICNKYYNKIIESNCEKEKECEDGTCPGFKVDAGIQNDFLKELQDIDTEDASELIRDRITDAITDFVDSNTLEKLEYEEIIQAAQDKIEATKSETVAESINIAASRKINEMKNSRKRSILHSMVESVCEQAIKDPSLGNKYISEGKIDMDAIVEDTELIYTMLEMINTLEMVPVDESYLKHWVK